MNDQKNSLMVEGYVGINNIIKIVRMSMMLIGYGLAYIGVNVMLVLCDFRDNLMVMIYWNVSNLLYLALNIILLVVINF